MATEAELQHLYQQLNEALDEQGANTMIELLGPYARHELATRADLQLLSHELRGEMADLRGELRGEMADLRGELRGEMADLRGELRTEIALQGQRTINVILAALALAVAVIGILVGLT